MLRGVVRWSAAVLAGVALATGVPAQGVNPSSTENVVPAATGLESERQALFQQMFRDPSNLDIAFRYAELSVRAGDLEAAIATLERMLVYAPGLPRLQFELGVLYFRLGAYETAATYLRAVESNPSVPADIQGEVALYLQTIDERA
jgi:tetratricopeptide (TPR) repeat protein